MIFCIGKWPHILQLEVQWPYGLGGTRLGADTLRDYVTRPSFVVLLGTGDTDTEDKDLRKSEEAELQGPHRFARGQQFVATAAALAAELEVTCGVEQVLVPGAKHSNGLMAPAGERKSPLLTHTHTHINT